jgi:DNA topoisomerase I
VRDETKFEHMLTFGRSLPLIRRRVEADLQLPHLPREKVLAAVVRLMERTLGRVGNPEYAKQNKTSGLTTLRHDHVRIVQGRIELDFRGTKGIHHHRVVSDPVLAQILEKCADLPGSELFQYLDEEGKLHHIYSEHVNDYLRDFRPLHHGQGLPYLGSYKPHRAGAGVSARTQSHQKRRRERGERVAEQLGNTPAVCRKSYIHPPVLACYVDGSLQPTLVMIEKSVREPELWAVEGVVMRLLAEWHGGRQSHRSGGSSRSRGIG